jgi:nitrite reductase (NO-forming)
MKEASAMGAPQLDTRPPAADVATPETFSRPTQPPQPEPSTNHGAHHEPMVDTRRELRRTAGQALATWWNHTLPPTVRMLLTQLGVAVAVVLVVLPLASSLGWFGLRTAAPSSASTTNQATMTMTGNQPSPNAPAHPLYNPQAPTALQGDIVNVHLTTKESLVSIAPGIAYQAWTFNDTVPGPVIRVRQGQTVHFTLTNGDSAMSHSIDFHAAQTAWNINYQPVAPGASLTFDWVANYPGAFLYHCGTPPVMTHMANGMYGAIIVDPANGWATPAKEYVLVQSEFYTQRTANGDYTLDSAKMMNSTPDYVTFNGYASQYTQQPLTVQTGQRVRLFVINAGPTHFSAFHVIGAIFSDSYVDGNPANHMVGNQTLTIPPGGGVVAELTIPEAGQYPFLTHSFMDASMGALGMIKATP